MKKRCAVYTRKSTEEGLDQDFNSLDAQHEACAAFIASQKHEGWKTIAARYDDGGFSGGNMDRPGLRQLLADVAARKVDVIVVYKIDRLTRTLADFAKMVEIFDAYAVSFVSVTQQFNTTTSMGRLTLNVLLSFAQFEREVTAERIRDKIAASKKKGMWMGGIVPIGYDVHDKKLVINKAEAETVRTLFRLYLELGTVRKLMEEADRQGIVTKRYVQANGIERGGRPFSRGHLHQLLRNPIYRGLVSHRGVTYPGQHAAVIDQESWEAVQAQLAENTAPRSSNTNVTGGHLLTGLVFDETGDRLSPSHAVKKGKRYRYYVSRRLVHREGTDTTGWRIAAPSLETVVIGLVSQVLRSRAQIISWLHNDELPLATVTSIIESASQLADDLEIAAPPRRRIILKKVLRRATLAKSVIKLELVRQGLRELIAEVPGVESESSDGRWVFDAPLTLKRRGVEMKLIVGGESGVAPTADGTLIRTIALAHRCLADLVAGGAGSIRELAKSHNVDESNLSRILPLAFLAPDIVQVIVEGKQPGVLTRQRLKRLGALPYDWEAQRKALGISN